MRKCKYLSFSTFQIPFFQFALGLTESNVRRNKGGKKAKPDKSIRQVEASTYRPEVAILPMSLLQPSSIAIHQYNKIRSDQM